MRMVGAFTLLKCFDNIVHLQFNVVNIVHLRFIVASGGVLSEGYGHGGPGVCLGDGQTEAEGVPSQGGRGDALLRRMPPYLT